MYGETPSNTGPSKRPNPQNVRSSEKVQENFLKGHVSSPGKCPFGANVLSWQTFFPGKTFSLSKHSFPAKRLL